MREQRSNVLYHHTVIKGTSRKQSRSLLKGSDTRSEPEHPDTEESPEEIPEALANTEMPEELTHQIPV